MLAPLLTVYFVLNILLLCFATSHGEMHSTIKMDYYWDENKPLLENIKGTAVMMYRRFKDPVLFLLFGSIVILYQFIKEDIIMRMMK